MTKSIRKHPDSLLAIFRALVEFTLMVSGIIGIAVQVFNKQGWLKQLFDALLNHALSTSLLGMAVMLGALVLAKLWFDALLAQAEHINKFGNMLTYGMQLLGAYFLFMYITTGSFIR